MTRNALYRRIVTESPGAYLHWPDNRKVKAGYNPAVVQIICVQDPEWQKMRLSMKGKPTHVKLEMLVAWWDKNFPEDEYATEVQVGNYLGALRRGGQLDMENWIQKYR